MMLLDQVFECFGCLRRACACGCEPKEGLCVKCDRQLCGFCLKEAHRDHRGMCPDCYHPKPTDEDLEEYDADGYRTSPIWYQEHSSQRRRRRMRNMGLG